MTFQIPRIPDAEASSELIIPRGTVDNSLWVDNIFQPASGSQVVSVDDSTSEEIIADVRSSTRNDVDRAFRSARAAQSAWAGVSAEDRIRIVRDAARILEEHAELLSDVLISEVGTARHEVSKVQIGLGLTAMRVTADQALPALMPHNLSTSSVRREPAGVVAAITPWNYPIFQVVLKVAPALISGCSVVLKPPGVAPLTAFAIAQALAAAGLPEGVLNVVCGPGGDIGGYIASHAEADFVSFTGSVSAGRSVAVAAAHSGTRTALELGGKSAALILDEDLLEEAVRSTFASAISNTGQTCAALSRIIVPKRLLARAEELAAALVEAEVVGDPRSLETTVGPMSNRSQRDSVLRYIEDAENDSQVRIIAKAKVADLEHGWFVPPTVCTADSPRARVVQEEIFGPVLTLQAFRDEEDAVHLANNTPFGLMARVWTHDPRKFESVAQRLRVGGVIQSGRPTAWDAPFGGVKASGYGRERGLFGVEEFLITKSIQPDF